MRITLKMDEASIGDLKRFTHADRISDAIGIVVESWLLQKRCTEFVDAVLNGEVDYGYDNDELERLLYATR